MSTHLRHISDKEFEKEIVQSEKPVLVDFWADWCAPCHAVAPTLEELGETFADQATLAKVNIDENPEATRNYGIRSIPTLILFKNGTEQERLIGVQPKGVITELLERYIA